MERTKESKRVRASVHLPLPPPGGLMVAGAGVHPGSPPGAPPERQKEADECGHSHAQWKSPHEWQGVGGGLEMSQNWPFLEK